VIVVNIDPSEPAAHMFPFLGEFTAQRTYSKC